MAARDSNTLLKSCNKTFGWQKREANTNQLFWLYLRMRVLIPQFNMYTT